jgi:hypothetical protein
LFRRKKSVSIKSVAPTRLAVDKEGNSNFSMKSEQGSTAHGTEPLSEPDSHQLRYKNVRKAAVALTVGCGSLMDPTDLQVRICSCLRSNGLICALKMVYMLG